MTIEAMKQALEALEGFIDITKDSQGVKGYRLDGRTSEWDEFHEVDQAYDAITSLHQAIAEAEKQEPVAWMDEYGRLLKYVDPVCPTDTPLYTHPQPKRECVWLTDEQIRELFNEHSGYGRSNFLAFARAIEAAHGIKEKNT
jgi:hypothetical protein